LPLIGKQDEVWLRTICQERVGSLHPPHADKIADQGFGLIRRVKGYLMKRFSCQTCGNEVHFENVACVNCGATLGYQPETQLMRNVASDAQQVLCLNATQAGCNWLLPYGQTSGYCVACQHNRVVPDPGFTGNRARWAEIELAKRKLIYALLRWNLPRPTKADDAVQGLAFDFLADAVNADGWLVPVGTGHRNGLITLNLAEGDDAVRAERKSALAEPYRTVIGHLRHEIGHYYWSLLVEGTPNLDEFRALFGDERQDYTEALQRHYAQGAPADWADTHISAYAAAHPWEDFAETWAHWMHIVDGLETAQAYGISLNGIGAEALSDPYLINDIAAVVKVWVPLTVAVNSMNRGMGQPDLYPFVLSQAVNDKLRFINGLIHAAAGYPG
jgi:hypothetical protein